MIGENYGAGSYERRLRHLAEAVGCRYVCEALPVDVTEEETLGVLGKLNADPRVSGILVLRPVPAHISEVTLYRTLSPIKDIESMNPLNAGLLLHGRSQYIPSTPASAFYALDRYLEESSHDAAVTYRSSRIVVLGRSNNVGKPAVLLALERDATVVSCDVNSARAGFMHDHTRQADILIVAVGVPGLIRGEHVKRGVIVIDIGINGVTGPDGRTHVVGDVDYESVVAKARAITPVPGGVGPITDVWLMRNTVAAAQAANRITSALDPRLEATLYGLRGFSGRT